MALTETECYCGLQFADRQALEGNVLVEHAGDVWKCSVEGCPKIYDKASSVRTHFMTRHSKDFRHCCAKCSYGHDELAGIKKHMDAKHGIPSDVRCSKCDKVFSQKNKLVQGSHFLHSQNSRIFPEFYTKFQV